MLRETISAVSFRISGLLILAIFFTSAAFAQFAYNFQGTPDGAMPAGALIRDLAGNLYGTTASGGAFGAGSIYELPASGGEKVLYSFTGGADGGSASGRILRQTNGNLMGTAASGGNLGGSCGSIDGCGVVWELGQGGRLKVLYTFSGGTDGAQPRGGLVLGANAVLYGTTEYGGSTTGPCIASSVSTFGCGVVFHIDHNNAFAVVHTFAGGSDGQSPLSPLTADASGNLYGTTLYGGSNSAFCTAQEFKGCGVVFRIDASSVQESIVYAFNGSPDAAWPFENDVTLDAAGNLYGSTAGGGVLQAGTVYKINARGNESVLYSFTGANDGALPRSGLIRDPKGNLYGTVTGPINSTSQCTATTCGGVFKLTPSGTESVIYAFPAYYAPVGDLLLSQGYLYGTTMYGGISNDGTVFKVKP